MIGQTEITTLYKKMTYARSPKKVTYTTYSSIKRVPEPPSNCTEYLLDFYGTLRTFDYQDSRI